MASDAHIRLAPRATIGAELERQRLELRAKRVRLVLAVLGQRSGNSTGIAPARPGLQRAIAQLSSDLSTIERRLEGAHQQQRNGREQRGFGRAKIVNAKIMNIRSTESS
jgi:hypothetical protein